MRGEQLRDLLGEARVEERAGGEVDGDRQVVAERAPGGDALERGAEHGRGERDDQPGLLGDRDELGRVDDAQLGVLPAGERLHADDPARAQLGLRLVGEHQLAALDRVAQLGGEREPARAVVVLAGLERRVAARGGLRGVHGDVGALDQRLDVMAVLGMARDADRAADLQRGGVDGERLAQAGEQALGDLVGGLGADRVVQEDPELVAAEPRDGVAGAQRRAQPRGDLLQQPVALVVAERVVDLLEVVEVHQHHRAGSSPRSASSTRSRNSTRLGSPVSASWTA